MQKNLSDNDVIVPLIQQQPAIPFHENIISYNLPVPTPPPPPPPPSPPPPPPSLPLRIEQAPVPTSTSSTNNLLLRPQFLNLDNQEDHLDFLMYKFLCRSRILFIKYIYYVTPINILL